VAEFDLAGGAVVLRVGDRELLAEVGTSSVQAAIAEDARTRVERADPAQLT
jgi:hypothetical protein